MVRQGEQWKLVGERRAEPSGTGGNSMPHVLDAGPTPTQTSITSSGASAADNTAWSGWLRNVAAVASEIATENHQVDYTVEFRIRTSELAGAGGQALLAGLSDLGIAWRDIARMINVSVPAIQKWRRGDGLTGENARKLARLAAGCEIIRKFNPLIQDVGLWFEVPIVDEAPVTPMDLWASGNQHLVFEHARVDGTAKVDPHMTMDSFDPDWRQRHRSDFETFRAGDGELSIRPRER